MCSLRLYAQQHRNGGRTLNIDYFRKKKGKVGYIPPAVLDELGDIMKEDKVFSQAEAFRNFVQYSRVGREAKRLIRLDFSHKSNLPPVNHYNWKFKKQKV